MRRSCPARLAASPPASARNPAWCDYQRGEQAGAAQADLLRTGPVMIRRLAIDHYGRTLALTSVNSRDAGTYLLKAALAQRWD